MKKPMIEAMPDEQTTAFRAEMMAVLEKYTGHLPSMVLMAMTAYTLGQIIAFQDQEKMSVEDVWDLIGQNIEKGNKDATEAIRGPVVGNA
jgi:uncharacterized protein YejL (UPF0352 family)